MAFDNQGNNEKDFRIDFKVFEHVDHSKRRTFLKLAKPDSKSGESSCERNIELGVQYPNVTVKRENATNAHAVNIMCNLNHHSILSMKAVGPKAQDDFLVFIEECEGTILHEMWRTVETNHGHIPSEIFQSIVTQIVEGVEFLRINGTYHGNLAWDTTFFIRPYTVKLCGFRSNDSVSVEESQWQDWMFLRQMLKYVSDKAARFNQSSNGNFKLSYAELDALIELIEGCDRSSLNLMKNIVLQDVFFWTKGRRTMFMMTTVSEFLRDPMFRDEINKSDVCEVGWDSDDINGSLSPNHAKRLALLIDHCNEYRARLLPYPPPPLDTKKKIDCVKLACISYTHQHQEDFTEICKGYVDFIFCMKYPKLFIELNRIIKARG